MDASGFGKWRSSFWPIHRSELKKFLPMFLIFFLIAFNYNVLRSYKDSIVVTASHSGAEALPFIKLWVVLPSALLFTLLFTRLSNWYSPEKVFHIIFSIFIVFFLLFGLMLYPLQEHLHPNELADRLATILPVGFKGFIAIFRNWTFTLFYVMSELWSSVIFTVLFWGFANEVTTVDEAKRFYGLLTFGGSIAGIFSGYTAIHFSSKLYLPWLPYGKTAWDQSIFFLSMTVIGCGLLTMAIFRWLNVHVITPSAKASAPKEKIQMSMRANFKYLARSKYLICIATIVFAYNVAINLVEIVWKDQMKVLYPNPSDYNTYMGQVIFSMAVIASLTGLLTTTKAMQRYSWTACALIPPILVSATGLIFFHFVFFPNHGLTWAANLFHVSPLFLCVTVGSLQNCLSRASKYTFFDATKELSFIPLNNESKLKGKAAIDGVGSRLGKSGGSAIHQGLILMFSSVAASVPYVAGIFIVIILIWSLAAVSLGRQFEALVYRNNKLNEPRKAS
ncbi:MAG: AAA family ATPase [Chlamydiae bacterium RIFCSPHIGHO2_12_FULL_44_59]|nr:MAG: AAA family ATPase [Chlamydiae bacterium RIFCSPHIGHO2_01_FULL_44_39]OGN59524.1 MAG: AAA family ATPase [Chlamydiae bacterium RIFCSPHIGHO2_12_FULL_44_59]OGN67269.1 MAG: AAA family ATPase [Chlamydiae bacterium RIFCSPLOWO2_01_FULL_44_52]OGN68691.1 MAG: AAA family ATPase [Chlamydiae bacterium RIFCSPLOWO2_02_FULL_45_22]OGN69212.1 MAG: AAA family ATPase [Chlamydiae bacterium RIFCSPLOWO2_12_FULL_45_20]